MNERTKGRSVSAAAMKAGMHRQTAARYRDLMHGPATAAALAPKRGRRRPDPLAALWPGAEAFLSEAPELEAKALFEHLLAPLHPRRQQRIRPAAQNLAHPLIKVSDIGGDPWTPPQGAQHHI